MKMKVIIKWQVRAGWHRGWGRLAQMAKLVVNYRNLHINGSSGVTKIFSTRGAAGAGFVRGGRHKVSQSKNVNLDEITYVLSFI